MIDFTTIRTGFGRWIEPVNQADNFTLDVGNVFEDAHKFGAGQIAYLATPKALHPLHGQIFKIQGVIAIRQLVSQLEKPITAAVDYSLIDTRDNPLRLAPSTQIFDLAGKILLGLLEFGHCLPIVQRAFNLLAVRSCEKSLQAKIKTGAVTRQTIVPTFRTLKID
jgi:hypothetical protein